MAGCAVIADTAELKPATESSLLTRRHFVSSVVLVGENFVRLGLVAAVSFWIAHALGPEGFGVLNYASAVLAVIWTVAMLGLETPVVARLVHSPSPGVVLGSAMLLRIVAGVVGAGLMWVAVSLMRPGDALAANVAAIVGLGIPLSAPLALDFWFKSQNSALLPASGRIIATILACALKVSCLLLGLGVIALAWTITVEAFLGALALGLAYAYATRHEPKNRLQPRAAELRTQLKECLPFVLSVTAIAAYMKIDVILMGALTNNAETGVYSLSQKLSETLYTLPVIVLEVLFPQLVKRTLPQGSAIQASAQTFFDLATAVALVAIVVALVMVSLFVPMLFGERYAPTVQLFHVHAWSCLGVALAHARFKWMAAVGLQSLAPVITVLGLVVSIVLNLVLIPRFGGAGAAAATVISYTVSGFVASFLFRPLRPAGRMQLRSLWPWHRLGAQFARR
jgi:O-antigen/teichoic acid export membrane protein